MPPLVFDSRLGAIAELDVAHAVGLGRSLALPRTTPR